MNCQALMVRGSSPDKGVREVLNKSSADGSCRFNQSFLKNRAAPHTLTRSLIRDFCSNSNGKSGAKIRLILVFNKTVKNRFIRLLFQQPAAQPQKNVSPYISRRHRRPAKDSQDKMVLTILSRNRMRLAGTIVRRCHRIPDSEVCMNEKRIMLHHGVEKVNNLPNTSLR